MTACRNAVESAGDSHHRPLAEPNVTFSRHSAPIRQTQRLNGLSVVRIVIILSPVVSTIRLLDPIPLRQPYYSAFIAPTDRSAPVLCIGTLASRFSPLVLLPCHQSLAPARH
jgi:hypothetical protein